MRYGVATLIAALMLFAGVALGGAGHGWVAGAFGCFVLAPLSFLVVVNGLSRTPSRHAAVAFLASGLALYLVVAIATAPEVEYLAQYMRVNRAAASVVAGLAYAGWLVVAVLATLRAWRVPRHGT